MQLHLFFVPSYHVALKHNKLSGGNILVSRSSIAPIIIGGAVTAEGLQTPFMPRGKKKKPWKEREREGDCRSPNSKHGNSKRLGREYCVSAVENDSRCQYMHHVATLLPTTVTLHGCRFTISQFECCVDPSHKPATTGILKIESEIIDFPGEGMGRGILFTA